MSEQNATVLWGPPGAEEFLAEERKALSIDPNKHDRCADGLCKSEEALASLSTVFDIPSALNTKDKRSQSPDRQLWDENQSVNWKNVFRKLSTTNSDDQSVLPSRRELKKQMRGGAKLLECLDSGNTEKSAEEKLDTVIRRSSKDSRRKYLASMKTVDFTSNRSPNMGSMFNVVGSSRRHSTGNSLGPVNSNLCEGFDSAAPTLIHRRHSHHSELLRSRKIGAIGESETFVNSDSHHGKLLGSCTMGAVGASETCANSDNDALSDMSDMSDADVLPSFTQEIAQKPSDDSNKVSELISRPNVPPARRRSWGPSSSRPATLQTEQGSSVW